MLISRIRERVSVRLGSALDTSNVTASYDNGVLTVTVPMRANAKLQKVKISSSGREALADVS